MEHITKSKMQVFYWNPNNSLSTFICTEISAINDLQIRLSNKLTDIDISKSDLEEIEILE